MVDRLEKSRGVVWTTSKMSIIDLAFCWLFLTWAQTNYFSE